MGNVHRRNEAVLKKIRIIHTTTREIDGKQYQAITWDCTPPGHEDAYNLSRTEWKILEDMPGQMNLF